MEKMTDWSDYQCLHSHVVNTFINNQLKRPTNIQAQLFTHYKHYYDFLIASQTGSGKTYAFAAPIVSQLLFIQERYTHLPNKIMVLVLTPTRQLAQQITSNFQTITANTKIKVTSIVGGLSKEKQTRIIRKNKPQIIVATPGRLNQLIEEQLLDLHYIKYLVIDQADRMIQMGHYRELDQILGKIFDPKLIQEFEEDFNDINSSLQKKAEKQSNTFFIKNEKGQKIALNLNMNTMKTDELMQVPQELFTIFNPNPQNVQKKSKKQNEKKMQQQVKQEKVSQEQLEILKSIKRRIFFISATLTREFKGTKYSFKKTQKERLSKKDKKMKMQKGKYKRQKDQKQKKQQAQEGQGYIPKLKALMSRVKFHAKPKIIDLSVTLFLPEKLTENVCYCQGDSQKISIMLCYLAQAPPRSKIIIFTNTIATSNRIEFFIQAMKHQCVKLHSHMQQRQRLKKLQRFKKAKQTCILIATDVAARGLDFDITHVLQYNIPINGDTYVHRIGRTARANKSGQTLTFVEKKQSDRWLEISDAIGSRSIGKYAPNQHHLQQMEQKVNNLEFIRRSKIKLEQKKVKQQDIMDAEEVGVLLEDQKVTPRVNRIDAEQKKINKQIIQKQIKQVHNQVHKKNSAISEQANKWKKNKLILSIDDIRKYL